MPEILRHPVTGPSAWTARDVTDEAQWTRMLSASDVAELDAALQTARATGRDGTGTRREDFPLPGLSGRIAGWIAEIEDGRGFLRLRGLPVDRYDLPSLYALYWGLGTHFGDAIVQNYEGRRINEVQSRGHSYEEVNIRAYATSSNLGFHNDPSDLTCLLCVRQAREGGLSHIASAISVYNDILSNHPEFLEPLCNGFHHDVRGEGPSGQFDEVTDIAIPVYSWFADRLSCCLNTKAIITGRQKQGGELSTLERAALDYIETRAAQPERCASFMLQPGDLLMMNNYSILHGRTSFRDWPDPNRARLLLRLWLNLHDGRPLAPAFTGRFNTGHRGGAVVHNHNDAALLAAGR